MNDWSSDIRLRMICESVPELARFNQLSESWIELRRQIVSQDT